VLLALQTATSFGPLPTSLASMIASALAIYVVMPIVGWRVERASPAQTRVGR
jgi:hypothetical protein